MNDKNKIWLYSAIQAFLKHPLQLIYIVQLYLPIASCGPTFDHSKNVNPSLSREHSNV